MSPTIQVPGFSEADKDDLIEQGVIGQDSALTTASYAVFQTLSIQAISQYAGLTKMPVGYTPEQILEMAEHSNDQHWLTSYLKNLRLPQISLQSDQLEAAFAGVLKEGLAEVGDYGYRLIGEAYDLAVNFLIIENVLHVRCGKEEAGVLVSGEALFLQAGLHDLLMLDVDAETVELNTISTFTMMEYLQEIMLQAPDFK